MTMLPCRSSAATVTANCLPAVMLADGWPMIASVWATGVAETVNWLVVAGVRPPPVSCNV